MRTILTLAVVVLLCTNVSFGASTPAPDDESVLEHNFDAFIHPNDLRDWMKLLAAEPNHVGSPHDKANAEASWQFKDWGWDAHIETFDVLYPTPISESLDLIGPKPFKATLQEPPIPGDSSATANEPACPPMSPIRAMAMSRPSGLCQLWHAGRLQGAASAWASASKARSSSRATARAGAD